MLYINNPDARTAIIEQARRDHGQHVVTVTDTDLSQAEDPRSRIGRTLGYLLRPVATS